MNEIMTPGITRRSEVRGGRPCIASTGIRVTDIVMSVQIEERSPSQIAEDLAITVDQVGAALDNYNHKTEAINSDIERQIETFERLSKEGYGRPTASLLSR